MFYLNVLMPDAWSMQQHSSMMSSKQNCDVLLKFRPENCQSYEQVYYRQIPASYPKDHHQLPPARLTAGKH